MTRDSNGAQKEKRGMFLRLERVSRDKVKPRKKIFFCLKRALFIFCKYEKKIVRLFRWPVQCRVAVVASQPGTRSTYCAVLCLARDGQGWRSCVIVSLIINRPCRGRQRRRGGAGRDPSTAVYSSVEVAVSCHGGVHVLAEYESSRPDSRASSPDVCINVSLPVVSKVARWPCCFCGPLYLPVPGRHVAMSRQKWQK